MSSFGRRILRGNLASLVSLLAIGLTALAVGVYVLHHERLRLPFLDPPVWTLKAAFSTAQAVTPGQGQTVRVSGIRIGDITGVKLRDGLALVTMQVDQRYRNLIHRDASALLRPKTGLKDMFIELSPGHAGGRVPDGWTLPVSRTAPDVNSDEILAMLDSDTRDYVKLLIHGLGQGLDGRGATLAALLRRLEPTHRDLARLSHAVALRHANLRRLVGHLARLNHALAAGDDDLARLVSRSASVFTAMASRERGITRTVNGLPAALRSTTGALAKVDDLARAIPSTTTSLRPVLASLTAANRQITPAARAVAPVLRDRVRPFTRAAQPLVRGLGRPSRDLAAASPPLTRATRVFNHLGNLLAFNPGGAQGPGVAGREEGYLFWLAWLGHQSVNLFGSADAHGTLRPIGISSTCSTLKSYLGDNPQQEFLLGLTPLVTSPEGCGSAGFQAPAAAARALARRSR